MYSGPERASDPDDLAWRERQAELLFSPRFQPAMRSCLGPRCRGRRTFLSAHAGERLCGRCKSLLNRRYGAFDDADDADWQDGGK